STLAVRLLLGQGQIGVTDAGQSRKRGHFCELLHNYHPSNASLASASSVRNFAMSLLAPAISSVRSASNFPSSRSGTQGSNFENLARLSLSEKAMASSIVGRLAFARPTMACMMATRLLAAPSRKMIDVFLEVTRSPSWDSRRRARRTLAAPPAKVNHS